MKYRLAIFDFDGTLASSLEGISACMNGTLAAFGYPAASLEEVKATVGLTLEDSVRTLARRRISNEQLVLIVKHYRELYDAKGALPIELFDGAAKLLEELPSHGIKSVLVSNKGRNGLSQLLERLRIWAFFDLVLSAEDVQYHKPQPELYFKHIVPAFAKVRQADTLVIGDAEIDIRFAKAAGLACCWARYGYGDAGKCHSFRPDYEIGQLSELRDILRGGGRD